MLTQRRQQQAIADVIHDLDPELDLDTLDEPYQAILDEVDGFDKFSALQQLSRLKLAREDLAQTIDRIMAMEPGYRKTFQSLDEIGPTIPQSAWFWDGWIPRGMLTLLAAWPGVGKTYIAQHLAHCTTGRLAMPDGQQLDIRSGHVIYVDAESFLADLYERGQAWQMDLSKLYPLTHPPREIMDMADRKYQDDLIDMCDNLRPDLIIIDSLSSVNARGENNIEDIRQILKFFVELAEAFEAALILVHHLRKPNVGSARPITMHDLRGSGHLVAMGRSFLGLDMLNTSDPNGPRLLKVLKKNRGQVPKPISIQFANSPSNPDVAILSFGQLDIFEQPATKTDQCADWLVDILAESDQAWADLIELGREAGFSRTTIYRARESLGTLVTDTLGPNMANNKWTLSSEFNGSESQEN